MPEVVVDPPAPKDTVTGKTGSAYVFDIEKVPEVYIETSTV